MIDIQVRSNVVILQFELLEKVRDEEIVKIYFVKIENKNVSWRKYLKPYD